MVQRPPPCYYTFTETVRNLKVNAIIALAETIRQVLDVDTQLPKDIGIDFYPEPITVLYLRVRGGYDWVNKKIVLPASDWCRKSLVHEILHSLSYFYRDERLAEKAQTDWMFVVDGLNEFFTGYVLYKTRDEYSCYDYWIERKYTYCKISYENYVKIFGALARALISLQDLKKIFFYRKDVKWQAVYAEFLEKYGLPNIFRDWPTVYNLEEAILEALKDSGRKEEADKFEALLNEDLRFILDYGAMIR